MDDHPSPYLRITAPSTTAINFTISSRTKDPSLAVIALKHAFRIVVAFYTILCTTAKLQLTFNHGRSFELELQQLLGVMLPGNMLRLVVEKIPWWMLCLTSLGTLFLCVKRDYTEESLLVLQGLGVQTSTSSSYFFLSPTTTFIPTTQIQDIVIHEAFRGFEVRFFLAIIVAGASEVVVVFPKLLPHRADLEVVWRGSRRCLYSGAKAHAQAQAQAQASTAS